MSASLDTCYKRYLAGHTTEVWEELASQSLRDLSLTARSQAEAVLIETFNRIAQNIETVAKRLAALGYKPLSVLVVPASKRSREAARALDEVVGGVPESVKAFYNVFESVDFMGSLEPLSFYSGLSSSDHGHQPPMSEPLVIAEPEGLLIEIQEGIEYGELDQPVSGKIILPMSPDRWHKHGYSGGEPLGVVVPDPRVDGMWSDPSMPFVNYLRLSLLDGGGFPGFRESSPCPEIINALRQGLIRF